MNSLGRTATPRPIGLYGMLSHPDQQLRRLMLLSRAGLADRIVVAGPAGLDMLGLLCRAGFEQVSYLPAAPPGGETYDVLLAAGFLDADALCACVSRTARHLTDGGVLACELPGMDDDGKVAASLRTVGLEVASTVYDLRDRTMVRHTLEHTPPLQRAA